MKSVQIEESLKFGINGRALLRHTSANLCINIIFSAILRSCICEKYQLEIVLSSF